jgi:GMP synthase (glutamine-hydrolysing)
MRIGTLTVARQGGFGYHSVVGPVLIVKTGSTLPAVRERRGDYEAWFTSGMGLSDRQVVVCRVAEGDELPDPAGLGALVVTGSSSMVSDRLPWSERTAVWLRGAVERGCPVLGVCYGHQLLAHAFGGTVEYNPLGRQIGTLDVTLTPAAEHDPLLSGFPQVLHVPVSHRQSVTVLPGDARLLATTPRDPHHAFSLGERAWGVQFHPEFDVDIVRSYIDARRPEIAAEGQDPARLHEAAHDTADGTLLLRRFAQFVRQLS